MLQGGNHAGGFSTRLKTAFSNFAKHGGRNGKGFIAGKPTFVCCKDRVKVSPEAKLVHETDIKTTNRNHVCF